MLTINAALALGSLSPAEWTAYRKPHILPRRLAIDKCRAFARGRIWGR